MLLKSAYKILKKENLIVEYFAGDLTIDAYLNYKQKLIQDPDFSMEYNYFVYFKDVSLKISNQEVSKYVAFSNQHLRIEKPRNVAIITKTPDQVVLTTLFKMQSKHPLQKVKIFSTSKSGLNWLGLSPHLLNELAFKKDL